MNYLQKLAWEMASARDYMSYEKRQGEKSVCYLREEKWRGNEIPFQRAKKPGRSLFQ